MIKNIHKYGEPSVATPPTKLITIVPGFKKEDVVYLQASDMMLLAWPRAAVDCISSFPFFALVFIHHHINLNTGLVILWPNEVGGLLLETTLNSVLNAFSWILFSRWNFFQLQQFCLTCSLFQDCNRILPSVFYNSPHRTKGNVRITFCNIVQNI